MRITDLLNSGGHCLSFEVFPPRQAENYEAVSRAAMEIAALRPAFMSVTYGAGGGAGRHTLGIAISGEIQRAYDVPALAHLTCLGADQEQVHAQLRALREAGMENILALRGDQPAGVDAPAGGFIYAADLIREIESFGGFCVGAACYPEGHVENPSAASDRLFLKEKERAGARFFTSQMFFDNGLFYKFLYQIRELGVAAPVIAGIMPVTNGRQIARICRISGTYLPVRFRAILDKYGGSPAAMRQAGIIYACEQIIDLFASGLKAVHVYSMNRPDVAKSIWDNLKELL